MLTHTTKGFCFVYLFIWPGLSGSTQDRSSLLHTGYLTVAVFRVGCVRLLSTSCLGEVLIRPRSLFEISDLFLLTCH